MVAAAGAYLFWEYNFLFFFCMGTIFRHPLKSKLKIIANAYVKCWGGGTLPSNNLSHDDAPSWSHYIFKCITKDDFIIEIQIYFLAQEQQEFFNKLIWNFSR